MHVLFTGGVEPEPHSAVLILIDIENKILGSILYHTHLLIRHEILCKALLLVRCKPREIGLILGKDSCHELDIRSIGIGKITVPGTSEVAIAPRPLFLTRTDVVTGHMEHTAMTVVLIASFEVVLRVHTHITGGYFDILIVRYVDACGVVHLVIGACGNRKRTHRTLSMVEDSVDVLWEDTLIIIVDGDSGVGPPEKSLRQWRAIVEMSFDLKIGFARTKGEASSSLLMEHPLILVDPHRDTAVGILFNRCVHRHIG